MTTITIGERTGTDTFAGVQDTDLDETAPTANHGTDGEHQLTQYLSTAKVWPIFRFTGLSNIPAGATISDAQLSIYCTNADIAANFDVFRVLRNWVVSEATWNIYSTGNNWATAGAGGSGTDIAASASGTGTTSGAADIGTRRVFTGAGMITDVQNIVNGGSNHGWVIKRNYGGADDNQYFYLASSDNATTANRPFLTVTYTVGIPKHSAYYRRRRAA